MTAYIIRHASKQSGNYYDARLKHENPPISRQGIKQSERLYRYLKDKDCRRIYVSSYIRTLQTISYTAKKLHLHPIPDCRLNEIDNGHLETMSDDEIRRQYPQIWQCYVEQTQDFRFPGGETGEEATSRIIGFLDRIQKDNENIIAVTHDGLIRCLFCHVVGLPVYKRFNFKVDTCGIMEIENTSGDGAWRLIRFNHKVF